MEADQRDLLRPHAGPVEQQAHRRGMAQCQRALDRRDVAPAAQHRAQARPERVVIGDGKGGTGLDPLLAIPAQQSRVDAVERSAAHQADAPAGSGHAILGPAKAGRS